jgi:hypothetical protein
MTRIGIALVGLGPGSQPHLKSLADLQHRAELRHAVCRRPAQADLGPFAGRVAATADLDAVRERGKRAAHEQIDTIPRQRHASQAADAAELSKARIAQVVA